jgi:Uma2 family endonuclease
MTTTAATTTTTPAPAPAPAASTMPGASAVPLAEQQHIVLHDVSWDFYERLLEEIGDRPTRVTFDEGSIEIMSPLPKHEKWISRIGRLVELMAADLSLTIEGFGSTTFRLAERRKGLEPDRCYYVQNAARVRDMDMFDAAIHPPPDLAIEMELTRRSLSRQPIYAALGVPELWRCDDQRFDVLLLGSDGTYKPSETSLAFPFLPMRPFAEFVRRLARDEQATVLREFREWVRSLPR